MSSPGASTQTQCNAGYYSNLAGSIACSACPAGSYCPSSGLSSPKTCSAGTYSGPAATSCTNCSPGSFTSDDGAPSCCPCCANFYTVGSYTRPSWSNLTISSCRISQEVTAVTSTYISWFSHPLSDTSLRCPTNRYSNPGSTSCTTSQAYTVTNNCQQPDPSTCRMFISPNKKAP